MILIFLTYIFVYVSASEFDPTQHENWNLLPHNKCGFAWKNRIIGGKEAPLNAYPWLVRIGYGFKDTKSVFFRCGGVLVTSKVVLTAGHCVYLPNEGLEVRTIRLGEHNTNTNPDCNTDFCADPVIDVAPSEIIAPKTFDLKKFKHDIAIIRLKDEIKFTSSIKPICFSSRSKNYTGSTTEVAGWGIYDINKGVGSTTLLFVKLKVVENSICDTYFGDFVKIESTQICAGGEVGKDSCGGDSGGPLMMVEAGPRGPRYTLLGLVSFGPKKCGKAAIPGVYTRVSSHMKWFLDNLEKTAPDSVKIQ